MNVALARTVATFLAISALLSACSTPAPAPTSSAPHVDHATLIATGKEGLQPLDAKLEGETKVFNLTAKEIRWEVVPGEIVEGMAYNEQIPGPLLRVTEGDRIRVNLKNELKEPTVVHFHGPTLPNNMDGVPDVTQKPIQPGESFVYEFVAKPAGTFVYHSHHNSAVQEGKGLYGVLIIDPKDDSEEKFDVDVLQVVAELGGFWVINGKAFPATSPIQAKIGQRVRIRLMNFGQFIHPMHLHGYHFDVVGTDGYPLQATAQYKKDTLNIAPGERYDIEFTADNPGTWVFHCHILSHVQNKGVEPGGMISLVSVTE